MQAVTSHSVEMPQGSIMDNEHRTPVTGKASVDPVAKKSKQAYESLAASALGLELGVSVIVGLLFGYWLDKRFDTAPWLMIVGVAFGFAAGIRAIVRGVKKADRVQRREEEEARRG